MAKLPVVSVVGRPNVGKSTLFNRILSRKIAVVDDQPGVTRDRNYMEASWAGVDYTLIDTGGMVPDSREDMEAEINRQVEIAVEESDAVLFLVDGSVDPTDLDLMIARRFLRLCPEKIILSTNKVESASVELEMTQYWSLGLGEPHPISSLHGKGVGDLLDKINQKIAEHYDPDAAVDLAYDLKIAVVGRPNAGKSSLINYLLNDKRVIVSPIAGTTRDSIDTPFVYEGKRVKLIDTAGLRKKSHVKDDVEYYSNLRSLGSIHRADMAILLIDTDRKVSEQDMKIIRHVIEEHKGLIVCWNKWDLVEKDHRTFDTIVKESREEYKELEHIPMLSISALTGKRIHDVLKLAFEVKADASRHLVRSALEDKFFGWVKRFPHPYIVNHTVRFLGIKQQKGDFPHFIIFCSNREYMEDSYIRFLKNRLYQEYRFVGSFIVIDFKGAGRSGAKTREEFNAPNIPQGEF